MIEAGFIAALGLLIVLARFNLRRILGYKTLVDVVATTFFCWIFIGTYAGMMTGLFAGVIVSLTLNALDALFGHERARLRRQRGRLLPSLSWHRTPGRLP